MTDDSLIRRSVRQARRFEARDLPAALAAKAALCLVDALRCQLEGEALPMSLAARQIISTTGEVPVFGTDILSSPADAAFAMAVAAAALLREDMHPASIGHHGIIVWPTLLALSGISTKSGADLLAAGVVGYEFGGRLGAALFDADLASRLRPSAFSATAGAAMAGAHFLGLDEDATVAAVALAVDASSGLNQWARTGGDEVFIQAGRAAQTAVRSLLLAQAGAVGSATLLEGESGLFAACGRRPPLDLGLFTAEPVISAVYNKALPICNFAQTSTQAAIAVARAPGFDHRRVSRIKVAVTEAARGYPGCDFTGPYDRPLQAQMSIQFGVAAALARGGVRRDDFEALSDADVIRLVGVCDLEADPAFTAAFPARQGARVEATLDDGRTVSETRDALTPATEEEMFAGLRRDGERVLGAAPTRRLLDLIATLPDLPDARELLRAASIQSLTRQPQRTT